MEIQCIQLCLFRKICFQCPAIYIENNIKGLDRLITDKLWHYNDFKSWGCFVANIKIQCFLSQKMFSSFNALMWMSFKSQNHNLNCSTKPCFYSRLYVMWIWVREGAASKSMYYVILNNQIFFTKKRLQLKMKFLYLTLFLLRSHVPRASPT